MTCLVNLSHKVAYSLLFRNLEIEICFHTAAVNMCRHSVPHTSWSKFRHTHLNLTSREYLVHNHLVYVAFVACFESAEMCDDSIFLSYLLARILFMCCYTVEIEFGWFFYSCFLYLLPYHGNLIAVRDYYAYRLLRDKTIAEVSINPFQKIPYNLSFINIYLIRNIRTLTKFGRYKYHSV